MLACCAQTIIIEMVGCLAVIKVLLSEYLDTWVLLIPHLIMNLQRDGCKTFGGLGAASQDSIA